jgi:Mg-chelatase subunit ChlD
VRKDLHIVGIIDASGSMSSWWKFLSEFWNESIPSENLFTITFDQKPRVCESNILSKRIQDHGGGMTAIPEAFKLFEEHLEKLSEDTPVTVLFISDGEDNNLGTLP